MDYSHIAARVASSLESRLDAIRSEIANAAQSVYNDWSPDSDDYDDDYGSGGICDEILKQITSVVYNKIDDVEVTEGGHDGDDHAYAIVYNDSEAVVVDIPPDVYETGGGYSWKKRPDVRIDASDVVIHPINRSDLTHL
jgi:hypothetical protein